MKKIIVCLLMAIGCVAFSSADVSANPIAAAMQANQGEVSGDLAYQILKYTAQELCVCESGLISEYENGEVSITKVVENGESRYLVSGGGGLLIVVIEGQL